MGHAGAIVTSAGESAAEKVEILVIVKRSELRVAILESRTLTLGRIDLTQEIHAVPSYIVFSEACVPQGAKST